MRVPRWPYAFAASVFLLLGPSLSSAQSCQTYTGLVYSAAPELKLELLVPQGAAKLVPVVVWIHGGGWKSGSRTPIPTRVSDLCLRGYAVASVDYRLTTTALWPAQIQDVRGAVRWLRAHAAEYGLDPDRFAAWGESAGGHLAAVLATSGGVPSITIGSASADLEGTTGGNPGQSSRVQAAVDWYGATDFLQMRFYPSTVNHDGATSDESKLVGGAIQSYPERVATANPITYASADDPPLLAMHGTLDKLIPFNQSQLLVDALNAAGASATLRPVQGAGHGGSVFDNSSNVQPVYNFLDTALLDPDIPAPTPPAPGIDSSVVVQATDRNASEAGPDPGRFTVTRNSSGGDLTVTYTVSGTATAGDDYVALPGSVTIPAGQSSADVVLTPVDDDVLETAETVILTLAGGSTASVALADVEPARPVVSVTLSDMDAAEPADSGELIVWRTGSTAEPLTVDLLVGGTAGHGIDYGLPLTVTIAAAWDRVFVKAAPIDDFTTEDPETVTLAVQASPSIHAAPYAGSTVTIRDDDLPGTPELAGLALDPASVTGSKTSTGTVVLDRVAPAGGAPVSLASSDPAAVVPASVTVAQGASSATFTVTTSPVSSTKTVTVSASRRGLTKTAALRVLEPAVSALTLTPGTFAGGCGSSTGKVTLTAKAPVGGSVVALTNTNPVAVVPASVTVPSGSTSATFSITAPAVTANQTGTVTASFGGGTRSAGLTVRPIGPASLALSPNPVIGPAPVQGTVVLECPAAPGDITVALSSTSTGVARPDAASLIIPAGQTQGTFTVTTSDVTVQSFATIKAAAGGVSKSVKLTVDP
jgi:acetyl esterase/lipase